MEVARPIAFSGTRREASPPAIAHIPPMQKPTSIRAASMTIRSGASAEARFATTSNASRPHSIHRRSIPPDAMTTNGANRAASSAGREIIRPALPVVMLSVPAMDVSNPTGSISVVTTENVARPTAITAVQVWRTESMVENVFIIQILKNAPNSGAIILLVQG